MAYTPLYQKFFTLYHQKSDGILKPENIKYKVFLKAVANYALTVDSGFDTLYLKRNTELLYIFLGCFWMLLKNLWATASEEPRKVH